MSLRGAPLRLGVLLAVLLPGCAAAPPVPSAAERDVSAASQRAARAYEQRDFARAASLYERALKISRSIEDTEGIAASGLSLARVHQAAGDAPAAHRVLDDLLANAPLPLPAPRRAEALGRKALLHLDAAQPEPAREFAERALAACGECAALAALATLRGRAELALGDAAAALAWSARAQAAASTQPRERANALRLAGQAHLARREAGPAQVALAQALELDRSLGLSERVVMDLMALGEAARQRGERDRARELYRRARAASAAAGDDAAARAAARALDEL